VIVIGVDPGIRGAIAFMQTKGRKLHVYDMPTREGAAGRDEVCPNQLARLVGKYVSGPCKAIAVVEDVGAMTYRAANGVIRGQGAQQSFAFGKATGMILGILAAHWCRVYEVKPGVWKALMKLDKDKSKSLARARQLFPSKAEFFKLQKHDGRAEAALLAFFGGQRFLGRKEKYREEECTTSITTD
jgi:crossover junction endodeoxyribonuclease RuvC